MFPVTITLHNHLQLAAVVQALAEHDRAVEAPAPVQETPPADTVTAAPETTATVVSGATFEQARDLILELSKVKGRDAAVEVLSKFGVAKVSALKPEQFAAVVTAAKAALA